MCRCLEEKRYFARGYPHAQLVERVTLGFIPRSLAVCDGFFFFSVSLHFNGLAGLFYLSRCQDYEIVYMLIMLSCLCNIDPLTPHFYPVKLGFAGVYISFYIFAQNVDCWYSLKPPQ